MYLAPASWGQGPGLLQSRMGQNQPPQSWVLSEAKTVVSSRIAWAYPSSTDRGAREAAHHRRSACSAQIRPPDL